MFWLGLISAIMVGFKLAGVISWAWWVVLSPVILLLALFIYVGLVIVAKVTCVTVEVELEKRKKFDIEKMQERVDSLDKLLDAIRKSGDK